MSQPMYWSARDPPAGKQTVGLETHHEYIVDYVPIEAVTCRTLHWWNRHHDLCATFQKRIHRQAPVKARLALRPLVSQLAWIWAIRIDKAYDMIGNRVTYFLICGFFICSWWIYWIFTHQICKQNALKHLKTVSNHSWVPLHDPYQYLKTTSNHIYIESWA